MSRFEQFLAYARGNRWYRRFAIFCRLSLAVGFLIAGVVKFMERFAAGLPVNNPMGHYLEALYQTGFYYPSLGVAQVIAAILLLIPRTALLGALMYFPIILNIAILTYAVRFEGTRIVTFMVLANIFLLCWDYDRLKSTLPFKQPKDDRYLKSTNPSSNRFPYLFFGFVFVVMASVIVINHFLYLRPGNSAEECKNVCAGNDNPGACQNFCDCIYIEGNQLDHCLTEFENATKE